MTATTNPTYEAAVKYADAGFRVIPVHTAYNGTCSCVEGKGCKSAGKHPMRNAWQSAVQPGEAAMRNWWDSETPKNIGIVTGPESNLLVLDVDGDAGQATLAALVKEHGALPRTMTAKTGSGGWHFFFRYPDFEVGNSAGKLGKGLDTRGKGGFVVAAPSVSTKGPYTMVASRGEEIADAPEWLLEKLRPKQRKAREWSEVKAEVGAFLDGGPEQRRLEGYTKGAIEHEVSRLKGLHHDGPISSYMGLPWNNTVFEVSANLIQLANADWCSLTQEQAYAIVYEHAPRDADFGDEIINRTFDSAKSKVDGTPAAYPPAPVDLLASYAGVDLNQMASDSGNEVISPAAEGGDDDDFTSNVTGSTPEPVAPVALDIPTLEGIPVLSDRLDPDHAARALAAQLENRYKSTIEVEVKTEDTLINLDDLIERPTVQGPDTPGLVELRDWVDKHLRSSTPRTFWEALGAVAAGTDTDGPTIVFKGGGPILAALAATLQPRIGDAPESMLFGPRISTRDVEGPHIVFSFDDAPCPTFDPLDLVAALCKAKAGTPLPPPADDEAEDGIRLPDYRAVLVERARLGLAPERRAEVTDDAS